MKVWLMAVLVWLMVGIVLGHIITTTRIRIYYYDPATPCYGDSCYDPRSDEVWPWEGN